MSTESTKRFNPNKFQHIGTVRQINQAVDDERGRIFWRRFLLGFLMAAVVGALALFAMFARGGGH